MHRAGTYGEVPARLACTIQDLVSELPRIPVLETVRKGFVQRTSHKFGQYAEHEIGQKVTSQQPIGRILRAHPRPSDRFLEDDLS